MASRIDQPEWKGDTRTAAAPPPRQPTTRGARPEAPMPRPTAPEPGVVVLSETGARQGVTGHNVRYVLWWGLAGVVAAFAVVYLVYAA
jgi:hypothetical protein